MGIGRVVLLAVAGLAVAAGLVFFFVCPCETVPGGYLLGDEVETPVSDWAFANDAGLCQIEVQRGLPHSINLNCMADADGALYLSCARCEGKLWSTAALERPTARIRIGDAVYPVVLTRVDDTSERERAWSARAGKVGSDPGDGPPNHWWSFRVESAL